MERMVLEAVVRLVETKGGRNRMRREDKVPAVIYGRGKDTQPLAVEGKQLRQVLSAGGSNVLIDLRIKQKGKKAKEETVMFKDIQRYILQKDRLLHVDFIRISMTDKIEVSIQVNFTGEPAGVRKGGILQLITREVAVKCLPGDIPEHIEVDLSGLDIGESINVASLSFTEGIELITQPEEPLAQVLSPAAEEAEPGEEAVEGEKRAEKEAGPGEAPDEEG